MSEKIIQIDSIGQVYFHKRKGAKSVKLKVNENGKVIVVMPTFMPIRLAQQFLMRHKDWLLNEIKTREYTLHDGLIVGRVHILRYVFDPTIKEPRARVNASQIIVKYATNIDNVDVQSTAMKACIRSLRREAEQFLPKRLADIADSQGYTYASTTIKQLRGRWGSCDQSKNITLNLFLMQLPIDLIDYVIFHELAHTRAMHHGENFWNELESHLPNAKILKKRMRNYQPTVPADKLIV